MEIGDLSERVTIMRPSVTVDPIGGETEGAPVEFLTNLPASVEPLAIGRERLQVAQLRGSVDKRVRIRWRNDITTAMSVVWRTKTLEIGVVEDHLPDELWLYCAVVQQ